MENKNNPTVFKMDADKVKLIVSKNFYFNGNRESEFNTLPGNLQRAINREAEFHVKTLSQTEGFSDILTEDNFNEAQKLHNAICEYIAHIGNVEVAKNPHNPQNKFAALMRADSEAVYKENFESNGNPEAKEFTAENDLHATTRRAKHLNQNIQNHKAKGVEYNAQNRLQNIYQYLSDRSK